ncbi:hypothetical protein JHK87_050145 [Glycine soja]|nr:hypothetical protein JHK87_050145 [Glycine soja]
MPLQISLLLNNFPFFDPAMSTFETSLTNSNVSSNLKDLVEFNITTQLPIKLNSSNYPVWFEQVDSLLIAVILLVMSLVTHLALPKPLVLVSLQHLTQTIPYGSAKINYFTSRATWLALQQAFSNRSRSPIMSLKDPPSLVYTSSPQSSGVNYHIPKQGLGWRYS